MTTDLTTLRTELAGGATEPDGDRCRRRLALEPERPVAMIVRLPAGAELRYGLASAEAPAIRVGVRVGDGEHRQPAPQPDAAGEWRVSLDNAAVGIATLELTNGGPLGATLCRPRIVGRARRTPPLVPASVRPAQKPVNVVLYVADTLRADRLSVYGYGRPTSPRLEQAAARSLLFRHAYAPGPSTFMSVPAFLSSRYPGELATRLDREGAAQRTLAEIFRDAGYATAGFQANPLLTAEAGYARGFEVYEVLTAKRTEDGPHLVRAEALHARALDWVRRQGDRPFFLYLQSMDMHFPYDPPPAYLARFTPTGRDVPPADLLEALNERSRRLVRRSWPALDPARYDAAIAYADHEIGALLDALDASPGGARTVVVLTADHGEPLGDRGEIRHGLSLYEEIVHVPLLVRIPGLEHGMRIDEVVSLLDLAPTIADLAGLPDAADFVGRSLLAAGSEVNPPMAVGELVAEGKALARYAREGHWKVVVEHDVAVRLFDLERDPGETRDVATEHPEVAAYMATLATTRPELPTAASAPPDAGLSAEERQRRAATLRALGYAE